jgi:hypothetical protein
MRLFFKACVLSLSLLTSASVVAGVEKTVKITVVLRFVADYTDIPMNAMTFSEGQPPKFLGAAYPHPNGICEIFVIEPKDVHDTHKMEILGHEILHCYRGAYHQ